MTNKGYEPKNKNSQQDLDKKIQKIERHIKALEDEVNQLSSVKETFETTLIKPIDKLWNCVKCGSRLGIYDIKTDELRVRYRDFYAWWKAGIGGYLKIVCRSCSHLNEIKYEEGKS